MEREKGRRKNTIPTLSLYTYSRFIFSSRFPHSPFWVHFDASASSPKRNLCWRHLFRYFAIDPSSLLLACVYSHSHNEKSVFTLSAPPPSCFFFSCWRAEFSSLRKSRLPQRELLSFSYASFFGIIRRERSVLYGAASQRRRASQRYNAVVIGKCDEASRRLG